jgi:hypothetical protein
MKPSATSPYLEAGITGLQRSGGHVHEEFLPQLSGHRAIKIYREMRDNDATVGAILYAIDKLLRGVTWRVEPFSKSTKDQETAAFVHECMNDMEVSWTDFISEVLSFLVYGWSFHEVVYKVRRGPDESNGRYRSKYDDGKVGWRKMPIRSQDTLQEWFFKPNGDILGMRQSAPPDYQRRDIPMKRALLFRTSVTKNNPEGRSVLRNAYRSWHFKKRIEEIEAIGIERDLAGFPVVYVDPSIMQSTATAEQKAVYESYKDMVINIRRDSLEGAVMPSVYNDGHKMFDLQLLSSGGARQFDTNSIITRYDQRIATTVLGDFILLGQQVHGSFAMSSDKTDMFATSLHSYLMSITSVINDSEVPRLMRLNNMDLTRLPRIVPGDIETPDLGALGNYIQVLAGAAVPLFPASSLEGYLREVAGLPLREDAGSTDETPIPMPNTAAGNANPATNGVQQVKKPRAAPGNNDPRANGAESQGGVSSQPAPFAPVPRRM